MAQKQPPHRFSESSDGEAFAFRGDDRVPLFLDIYAEVVV